MYSALMATNVLVGPPGVSFQIKVVVDALASLLSFAPIRMEFPLAWESDEA